MNESTNYSNCLSPNMVDRHSHSYSLKAASTKLSMQIYWYHKNTREHTYEYVEAKKQMAKKLNFIVIFLLLFHAKLLISIAYQLKQILSYITERTSLSSKLWLKLKTFTPMPFWGNKQKGKDMYIFACVVDMQTQAMPSMHTKKVTNKKAKTFFWKIKRI